MYFGVQPEATSFSPQDLAVCSACHAVRLSDSKCQNELTPKAIPSTRW